MKREDIQKMARDIIESGAVESDNIESRNLPAAGIPYSRPPALSAITT